MRRGITTLALCFAILPTVTKAQAPAAGAAAGTPAPPPATKLEAFKPAAGSVTTMGYSDLGRENNIEVDVREMRDAKGLTARGLVVQVTQSEYREERAFVDADEIPELIKGIDALLGVTTNPTSFENFEVRYSTKGDLQITAFNSSGKIKYAVETGRIAKAQVFADADAIKKLRAMFVAAQQKLAAP